MPQVAPESSVAVVVATMVVLEWSGRLGAEGGVVAAAAALEWAGCLEAGVTAGAGVGVGLAYSAAGVVVAEAEVAGLVTWELVEARERVARRRHRYLHRHRLRRDRPMFRHLLRHRHRILR